MASYGGYKYYIDEISSKYNEGYVRFRDMIEMGDKRITNVANPTDDKDAVNSITADNRYPRKTTDNVFTGTNIFQGDTEFGDVVIDNLSVTGILLFGDILPNDDDTYNIGSISKRFRDLRLSNNANVGGNLNVGGTGNFGGIVNFWEKVNFFKDITIFERASFIFNVGDNSYNISYNDKDGVVRKSQHWSHIINNNCEVIGGDIDDRIGNSMLSVIGALGVSTDLAVGGTSIFDDDIFVKSNILFNEGGATDPHIGWDANTLDYFANTHKFLSTSGATEYARITSSGLDMNDNDVFDTGDLIPAVDNSSDIGSAAKAYKNQHLAGKRYSGGLLVEDAFYNTSRTITIPAPDTGGETIGGVACHTYIQNKIDELPKFIPQGVTVTIQFSAGTYKFSATNTIETAGFYGGGDILIVGDTFTNNANLNQNTIFEDLNTNDTARCWRFLYCDVKIDVRGIRVNGTGTTSRPFFFGFLNCSNVQITYCSYKNTAGNQRGVLAFAEGFTNIFVIASMFSKSEYCFQANNKSEIHLELCVDEDSSNKPSVIILLQSSKGYTSTTKPDFAVSEVTLLSGSLYVVGGRTITADSV